MAYNFHFYVGEHTPRPLIACVGADGTAALSKASVLTNGAGLEHVSLWYEPGGDYGVAYELRDRLAITGYPVTCTVHGLSDHRLLHEAFLRVLLCNSYPTDSFICSTDAARRALRNVLGGMEDALARRYKMDCRYRGRFDVVPLCVDTDTLRPGDKMAAKHRLRIPSKGTMLLYLGRLSLAKADLFPALLALTRQQLMDKHDLILVIAGTADPGFQEVLDGYVQTLGMPRRRVRVFVDITDETKLTLLQAADIFVSPSDTLTESFGLAPVEAMAAGVPQVVSDWNGYKETVEEGITGFRIPTIWAKCDSGINDAGFLLGWMYDHVAIGQTVAMDLGKWCAAIEALATNRGLRDKMSAASRHRAVQVYGMEAVRQLYAALWKEVLEQQVVRPREGGGNRVVCRPEYYRCFQHYSSAWLSPNMWLRAGDCDPALETAVLECLSVCLDGIIDLGLLVCVLATVRKLGEVTVGELIQRLPSGSGESGMRHLMWVVKYGFVYVEERGQESMAGSGA